MQAHKSPGLVTWGRRKSPGRMGTLQQWKVTQLAEGHPDKSRVNNHGHAMYFFPTKFDTAYLYIYAVSNIPTLEKNDHFGVDFLLFGC